MKATVYIATSLDGFIARENGGIDWLTGGNDGGGDGGPAEDYGYKAFFDSVDALVMGRNTYELVRTFGQWPYGSKPVFVLTTRGVEIPDSLKSSVETLSGNPRQVVEDLGTRGIAHIYVDGGKTVQGFIAEGLVQRLIITRVPILIGRGIPLFGAVPHDIRLKHIETRPYSSGLVQSEYEVVPG